MIAHDGQQKMHSPSAKYSNFPILYPSMLGHILSEKPRGGGIKVPRHCIKDLDLPP